MCTHERRDHVGDAPVAALSLHIWLTATASVDRRAVVRAPAGVTLTRPADRGDVRVKGLNPMQRMGMCISKTRTSSCDNITDLRKDFLRVFPHPDHSCSASLDPAGVSCSRTLKQDRYLCWGLNSGRSNKYSTQSILHWCKKAFFQQIRHAIQQSSFQGRADSLDHRK